MCDHHRMQPGLHALGIDSGADRRPLTRTASVLVDAPPEGRMGAADWVSALAGHWMPD